MRFSVLLLSLSFASLASAQIDPSSALLLNPDTGTSTREGGLDSGRYTVKPTPKTQTTTAPRRVESKEEARKAEQRPASDSQATSTDSTKTFAPESAAVPKVIQNPQPGTFLSGAEAPLPPPQPISETVLGGSDEEIKEYKQMLNPEDRRNNLMELSIAPAFIYNDSKSPYSFRKYSTASPAIGGDGRVWFTPFFGVQAGYMTTLSGSVSDTSVGSPRTITVAQTFMRAGIRSRNFLATGKYSPSLTWGLDFYEHYFIVPRDAETRGRLRTNGAQISLEGEWPTSGRNSWLLGVSFLPMAAHKEYNTGLTLKSGSRVDTNGVGISIGTKVQYDRSSALFIRLSHQVDKHVFTGQAATADPNTGAAPSGVPVTNSFTILQLGYTWGN
jgi:hypothetical protein